MPPSAITPPKKKKNSPGASKGSRGQRRPRNPEPDPVTSNITKTGPKQEGSVKIDSSEKPFKLKEEHEIKPRKIIDPQPSSLVKSCLMDKENSSTYTSLYSKKLTPKTVAEWNKLKTSCAMMLSSGTKGTSKVSTLF